MHDTGNEASKSSATINEYSLQTSELPGAGK